MYIPSFFFLVFFLLKKKGRGLKSDLFGVFWEAKDRKVGGEMLEMEADLEIPFFFGGLSLWGILFSFFSPR